MNGTTTANHGRSVQLAVMAAPSASATPARQVRRVDLAPGGRRLADRPPAQRWPGRRP